MMSTGARDVLRQRGKPLLRLDRDGARSASVCGPLHARGLPKQMIAQASLPGQTDGRDLLKPGLIAPPSSSQMGL
jgi:hypothetical protein